MNIKNLLSEIWTLSQALLQPECTVCNLGSSNYDKRASEVMIYHTKMSCPSGAER